MMETKNYLVGDMRKHFDVLDEFTEIRINGSTDFKIILDNNNGEPYVDFIEKKKTV